jgi:tetratricopeptide (TPR) repeat protein
MKRVTDEEKHKLGIIIHHYRNEYFHSKIESNNQYKQINFCKDICSQAQLSRLEHGDVIRDSEIYEKLLSKLNLRLEKLMSKDVMLFESYFDKIITYQNDDNLIINYNEYIVAINKFQNIFKDNIIYTHYNYALEFIISIIAEDYEEASYLVEDISQTIEVLPKKYASLTLHYIGNYYNHNHQYDIANKFYLVSIEYMHKHGIKNQLIYVDIAYNYLRVNRLIQSFDYLNKALFTFENTHNYLILHRIYKYLAIIFLKQYDYAESLVYLDKSINCFDDSKKRDLLSDLYNLRATINYLNENYHDALDDCKQSIKLKDNDKGKLIDSIIKYKLNQEVNYTFEDVYNKIKAMYLEQGDKEVFFHDKLEDQLIKFDEDLKFLLINDMYHYLKDSKKYKKALDIYEHYIR